MEFSIGMQVSREFSFEETQITNGLSDSLNSFFLNKDYGINKIYSDFICVSKPFEAVMPIRPLKVLKNNSAIEYETKVDFEEFKKSSAERRYIILVNIFFDETIRLLSNKKIKNFDFEKFKTDFERWYNSLV